MTQTDITTCQVCGRAIKANTGVIAHHGYQRKYGWQSSSCEGARYLPYEKSCDRLKEVLVMVKQFVESQEKELENFLINPPVTISVRERLYGGREGKEIILAKPDNFVQNSYGSNTPRTYENAYDNQKRGYERTIRMAKIDVASMERRLAEWKPVEVTTSQN